MLERRKTIKFIFENPGAQITASFHPIKRVNRQKTISLVSIYLNTKLQKWRQP